MTDACSGSIVLCVTTLPPVQKAILETLAYSDVFDYPLTFDELHRYLTVSAPRADLEACLSDMSFVSTESGFYFLADRDETVRVRMAREQASRITFQRACRYGYFLGSLPFVRMVTLTGSLAMLNLSRDADMDYMLVTQPGRLWLARAFAVTFGRLMRLLGDRICVNLLISESTLEWSSHDLYSAREMCQMIPVTSMDVYSRLRKANAWIENYLPNATSVPQHAPEVRASVSWLQKFIEILLRGKFGDILENRVMDFQMNKIYRTYGKGQEANFSTDLCQGNFNNHRAWTDQFFHERLALLVEGESKS